MSLRTWLALLSTLLWVSGTSMVQAGNNVWTSLGPEGMTVTSLALDPNTPTTLYAGTDNGQTGGVFKSTTGGSSWSAVNTGLPNPVFVEALALDPRTPTTLYAGTDGDGVFKSTTGGSSWFAVNTGLPADVFVIALAIDPTTPTTLYAGTGESGVFKSTSGGSSWSAVNTGLPAEVFVRALALDPATPTTLYAGLAGTDGGVFKSTTGGSSWSAVNTGLPNPVSVIALALDPSTPTTLYAGTASGVFKSTSGGSSWFAVNPGLPNTAIFALALDPTTPTTLYAGTFGGGVFKSISGGSSWFAVNPGLPNTAIFALALVPTMPTTLYAGTEGDGVFAITFMFGGLTLSLNQPTFHTGNQLSLTAQIIPGPTPVTADVYIALQPPGCTALTCLLFWQGGLNFTTTPQPLLRNWSLSAFNGPIFNYTFGGTEPMGTYVWLGAFTVPGTANLLGEVTQAPFTFNPLPPGPGTITFSGLSVNGSPLTTYNESGFTVSPTLGRWEALTTYGNPAPSIIFRRSAAEPTITAEVQITAGGSVFGFSSVDLYSSVTPIPYTITGLRNSNPVFTLSNTVPDTFGNFATVQNPNATDMIDTLLIRLSNPATPCCSNPMGLDNIVVTR